jgi:S-adenosylmethionine-diacylgycerolhomoserine-N-methlytransferase
MEMTDQAPTPDHGLAMDNKYKHVRHVYDMTRFGFLLGRNRAIKSLAINPGKHILEIGCGTGRNLHIMSKSSPNSHYYGIDISEEMLKSATQKLRGRPNIKLEKADASNFSGQELFGKRTFDGILMSFTLSMMPEWQKTLDIALSHLGPNGIISIVDFGDFSGFGPLRSWAISELGKHQAPPIPDLWEQIYDRTFGKGGRYYPSSWQSYRGFIQFATIQQSMNFGKDTNRAHDEIIDPFSRPKPPKFLKS